MSVEEYLAAESDGTNEGEKFQERDLTEEQQSRKYRAGQEKHCQH